jgi:putative transposase
MVQNHRLARAINDAAWGQFIRIIGQKCDRYGRTMHRVSRWLASSKICSDCGHQFDELTLTILTWTCLKCGAVHDRDHNAAKNILAAGRAERQNACGVPVSPPTAEVRGDEAGSTPGAA